MRLQLKPLIRKIIQRKKHGQSEQYNTAQQHSSAAAAPAPVVPRSRNPSRLSSFRQRFSRALSDDGNSDDTGHRDSSGQHVQSPLNYHEEDARSAGIGHVLPEADDVDTSVAENYEAYLPVISPLDYQDDEHLSSYATTNESLGYFTGARRQENNDVGDTSLDSTVPNQSLWSQFEQPSSSGSSIYQDSPHDSMKVSPVSARRSAGEALSDRNTTRAVDFQEQSAQPYGSPTTHALSDRNNNPTNHGLMSFGDQDIPNLNEQPLQDSVSANHSKPDLTAENLSLSGIQSAFDDKGKVFRDFELSRLSGIVDLKDSVDVDKTTEVAPAVTHEVVKPKEHEIVEERIFREIHNHEVYHRILPVHEVEVLPARHFIHNPEGELVEVPGDPFEHLTGVKRSWDIVKRQQSTEELLPQPPRRTEPIVIADRTYITLEGYPRRETTILHPPELEDLTGYEGPVMPIEFTHISPEAPVETQPGREKSYDTLPPTGSPWLKELMDSLPTNTYESPGSSSVVSQAPPAFSMR